MQVTVCGLRGGVGTTSIVAMLADALSLMGESVLLIDLNPSDLLRLHFNTPYADINGWAFGEAEGSGWQQHTYQVKDNLCVLPYGRHGLATLTADIAMTVNGAALWSNQHLLAATGYAWVIFDVPSNTPHYASLCESSDLNVLVAQADMASHILLGQYPLAEKTKVLVNQLNVQQRLSDAVLLDWNIRYGTHLVPLSVRQDLHIQDAFVHKMPATTYFPNASAACDMVSLATWCLVQRGVL